MENTTSAIWLKVGDRFKFPGKENAYYVTEVKPALNGFMKVFIKGSKAKCFTMKISEKVVKVKA